MILLESKVNTYQVPVLEQFNINEGSDNLIQKFIKWAKEQIDKMLYAIKRIFNRDPKKIYLNANVKGIDIKDAEKVLILFDDIIKIIEPLLDKITNDPNYKASVENLKLENLFDKMKIYLKDMTEFKMTSEILGRYNAANKHVTTLKVSLEKLLTKTNKCITKMDADKDKEAISNFREIIKILNSVIAGASKIHTATYVEIQK